jgi:hypothetical protein
VIINSNRFLIARPRGHRDDDEHQRFLTHIPELKMGADRDRQSDTGTDIGYFLVLSVLPPDLTTSL